MRAEVTTAEGEGPTGSGERKLKGQRKTHYNLIGNSSKLNVIYEADRERSAHKRKVKYDTGSNRRKTWDDTSI